MPTALKFWTFVLSASVLCKRLGDVVDIGYGVKRPKTLGGFLVYRTQWQPCEYMEESERFKRTGCLNLACT